MIHFTSLMKIENLADKLPFAFEVLSAVRNQRFTYEKG
jgi:hypothetical protein